ncbi:hypothetical protein M3Y95_00372500 [Aphelenchoides besseyi]|nr:hypothetical protein M3Y95_00372500 [Aphelenchoides besseyi]
MAAKSDIKTQKQWSLTLFVSRTIPECALINNALGYKFKKILSNQLADTSKATAFLLLRGLVSCQIQESDFPPKISGGTGTEIDRRRLATTRRDAGLVLDVENVLDEIRERSKNKSQEAYRQAKFLLDRLFISEEVASPGTQLNEMMQSVTTQHQGEFYEIAGSEKIKG